MYCSHVRPDRYSMCSFSFLLFEKHMQAFCDKLSEGISKGACLVHNVFCKIYQNVVTYKREVHIFMLLSAGKFF